jgi:hypothetical protein
MVCVKIYISKIQIRIFFIRIQIKIIRIRNTGFRKTIHVQFVWIDTSYEKFLNTPTQAIKFKQSNTCENPLPHHSQL